MSITQDTEQAVALPTDLERLSSTIDAKPEAFASGDDEIQSAALQAARYIFELTVRSEKRAQSHISSLLAELSNDGYKPQTRAQARALANGESTHQDQRISDAILRETPLPTLLVDDMEEDQIWAQLELKAKNVCDTLGKVFDSSNLDPMREGDMGMGGVEDDEEEEDEEDEEYEDELDDDTSALLEKMGGMDGDWDEDEEDEEMYEEEEGDESVSEKEEDLGEGVTNLRDASSDEDELLDETPSPKKSSLRKPSNKSHAVLDDGFFNLADFNAQTEEAESRNVSRGSLGNDSDDEEEEEEGLVNLYAAVDDGDAFAEEDIEESGEAYYKDFFGPPDRVSNKKKGNKPERSSKPKNSKVRFHEEVKVKNIKSQGKGLKLSMAMAVGDGDGEGKGEEEEIDDEEDDEGEGEGEEGDTDMIIDDLDEENDEDEESLRDFRDGREAVDRLKDDLFADDEAPKSSLSTHETRMEELKRQIANLEEENVAEKGWVLKGEVSSRGRPQNALLEEDLDFERLTKPVPVVSEEVVQDLEARIKSRIVEGRFDDVVRRKAVDDKPFLPSRLFELQDSKSKESLSQIYEKEYMASQGGEPLDDRDGKLQKEHDAIDKLWEGISYKLDSLCNAHFTPKQPKASISTVSNAAAVTLESALPTAQSASTILAPEEVFAAASKALQARSEMTPIEKRAARGRERNQKKKQRQMLEKSVDKFAKLKSAKGMKGVKQQKDAALKSMVKSGKGVTVIGKTNPALDKKKRTTS